MFNILAGINKNIPKHIAISMEDSVKGKTIEELYGLKLKKTEEIIALAVKLNIPVATFYLTPLSIEKHESFPSIVDALVDFFGSLSEYKALSESKIKVSVIGKWYDLPDRAVEKIKKIMDDTRDYADFFVNFCVNYDGQQEIVDAARIIGRMIKAGRLDPDVITKPLIKENIYNSYFVPPELIIKNGRKELNSFLLWDSAHSLVYFTGKFFLGLSKNDLMAAIKFYKEN
ncbi:undecaprenyl diphosphate synthase family protein [Candidatus Woesearchaeota archaeon]|nr:undecaprenyl diphosphate synthase family protein [Candidatus Woesearchaeota archaeon]